MFDGVFTNCRCDDTMKKEGIGYEIKERVTRRKRH